MKLLAVLLFLLAVASLAAGCCLDIWDHADAGQAWTAFEASSAALLALHIPSPAQVAAAVTGGSSS